MPSPSCSALPLPSRLGPAFWRQREDLVTPGNGNIASKSFKWFQKTSATVLPLGKGCHLPFLSVQPAAGAGEASAERQPAANPAHKPGAVGGSTRHPPPIAWNSLFPNPAHKRGQRLRSGLRETRTAPAGLGSSPQIPNGDESCTQQSTTPGSTASPATRPELPRSIALSERNPLSSAEEYWGSLPRLPNPTSLFLLGPAQPRRCCRGTSQEHGHHRQPLRGGSSGDLPSEKQALPPLEPPQIGPAGSSATYWVTYQQPYGHLHFNCRSFIAGDDACAGTAPACLSEPGLQGRLLEKSSFFLLNRLARERAESPGIALVKEVL